MGLCPRPNPCCTTKSHLDEEDPPEDRAASECRDRCLCVLHHLLVEPAGGAVIGEHAMPADCSRDEADLGADAGPKQGPGKGQLRAGSLHEQRGSKEGCLSDVSCNHMWWGLRGQHARLGIISHLQCNALAIKVVSSLDREDTVNAEPPLDRERPMNAKSLDFPSPP